MHGGLPTGLGIQRIRGCPVTASYTAVIQQSGDWWIGWVEEVPGVNSQGKTREELMENLHSALQEALEMNRADALAACEGAYEEVSIPQ
jgi:predicted RNase H-like HicB family nuclease